jgi:predicted Zn-dependent peptidase
VTFADRSALPRRAQPAVPLPPIHRADLDNGLRLWTIPVGRLPIVSVLLLIEAGSAADPLDATGSRR